MLNPLEKNWYVVYTLSKHEKQVDRLLSRASIESFLPMYTEIRQWSDRKKKVILPLFPNYLFVCINPKEFWKVLKLDGVIKFVSSGFAPEKISNRIIHSIQRAVRGEVKICNTLMKVGEKIRAISGPFMGTEGHFVKEGKKDMLIVNVELLHRSVLLEVSPNQIEKIENTALS